MGLDTYAARAPLGPEVYEITDDACGLTRRDLRALRRAQKERERANDGYCVFGGNYFRGKLYSDLVEHVTGVSIYEWWIPPETVSEMAEAFERCDPDQVARECEEKDMIYAEFVHEVTIGDLRAFFGVCARRGLGLVGSW